MIIQICEGLRIRRGKGCWNLEKIKIRNGNPDWAAFRYVKSLSNAKMVAKRIAAEFQVRPDDVPRQTEAT